MNAMKHKYIIVQCLISIIAASLQSFGETKRHLVICIDFTVTLALHIGDDNVLGFFGKFLRK